MKFEWVYVIQSLTRKYTYTGITNDIERRFMEHNSGYNKTTRTYAPFRIILREKYQDKKSARVREKFLKSGKGREFLDTLK